MADARPTSGRRRVLLVTGAAVLLVAAGALLAPDDPAGSDPAAHACNGSVALCDRPYDEVAFPTTHNSMSAADAPGWYFAEQPTGIVGQLDAGVRAFLVDAWPGRATQHPGLVTTADRSRFQARAAADDEWGAAAVDDALTLSGATEAVGVGPVEPYLCHNLCELGATPMGAELERVAGWLADHPREVVTFVVQDEGVTPAQLAGVVTRAGLLPSVYRPPHDGSWPTLGRMVASGRRVVVMMEHVGGGARYPWLLQAFDAVQDTPYSFDHASDFSCDLLRGSPDNALLLVNHWLSSTATRRSDATEVNAQDVLWPRVEQCREQRGQVPSFVAVDFYDRGDLFAVVDRLNGS
ncbi:hypothetical protein Cch01nite_17960 [Cellulomonas chitinilytica]|uniref:Uncharacterized protein n=1 Tax=Cellulomonas chitinilytica TaxID=398759 RepID=A0A919P0P4_9CELL|nr:hypothetical protein [Cellulomonas chitinilytica]GIG21072.1 hypothetical protein Cch01nite_17960 [Cellulomonas chitinilytica]